MISTRSLGRFGHQAHPGRAGYPAASRVQRPVHPSQGCQHRHRPTHPDRPYSASSGRSSATFSILSFLSADSTLSLVQLTCTGQIPLSQHLIPHFPLSINASNKRIHVLPTTQVATGPELVEPALGGRLFAVGDCCDAGSILAGFSASLISLYSLLIRTVRPSSISFYHSGLQPSYCGGQEHPQAHLLVDRLASLRSHPRHVRD